MVFARALLERVLCWLLEKCTAKWWLPGRARAPHAIFSLRCHRPEESRKGVSNEETGQTGKGLTIAGHSELDTRRPQMVGFREVCAPGCMYGGFFSISFCFCLFVCLLVFFFCLYIYIYIFPSLAHFRFSLSRSLLLDAFVPIFGTIRTGSNWNEGKGGGRMARKIASVRDSRLPYERLQATKRRNPFSKHTRGANRLQTSGRHCALSLPPSRHLPKLASS